MRAAIAKIGGTPPENIPPAEPIKNVEKRLKKSKPKLELDDKDAAFKIVQRGSDSLDIHRFAHKFWLDLFEPKYPN